MQNRSILPLAHTHHFLQSKENRARVVTEGGGVPWGSHLYPGLSFEGLHSTAAEEIDFEGYREVIALSWAKHFWKGVFSYNSIGSPGNTLHIQ